MEESLRRAAVALVVAAALYVVVALVDASTASAIEVAMQDDATVVKGLHDRDLALRQFRAMGGTHVRINLTHRYGPARSAADLDAGALVLPLDAYDDAVRSVREHGLVPELTLVWYGQSDPAATARWMGAAAAHFAGAVDRYSVLNEPDLTIPSADDCDPVTVAELLDSGALTAVTVRRRVRVFLGRHVRVRRHGRTMRVWRALRVRKRIPIVFNGRVHWVFQRVRRYRWATRSAQVIRSGDPRYGDTLSARAGCLTLLRGRKYRRVFLAAEPAIRAADPGAQVLAGETSPHIGLDLFVGATLPIAADGWAHHPYQWDVTPDRPDTGGYGIGRTREVQALVGMPLYYTEFGYPRSDPHADPSTIYTDAAVARALPRAWDIAQRLGVRQMLQYGWFSASSAPPGAWNTSLLAGDDGATTPAFDALASWLRTASSGG